MSKPPMVFDPAAHTGAGRSKRRPPPRPAGDSLPRFDCGVAECGAVMERKLLPGEVGVFAGSGPPLLFCSWDCASRFTTIQGLRQ